MQRAAVRFGEHQAGLDPGVARGELVGPLLVQVRVEHGDGVVVEDDGGGGFIGLGCGVAGFPPVLDELVEHVDGARPQVGVDLAQAAAFAAAESGVGDEVEQGVEPVVVDVVEEQSGEVGCPHHHRGGDLTGFAPSFDPLGRPHDRLGSRGGRHLYPLRRVERDQLLADGVVERRAQGFPDALHRRRPDRPLILDRRDPLDVAALPREGDLVVVFDDGVEHVGHVGDADLVDPQRAQVWGEVEPDVGFVAAAGVAGQALLLRQPPGQPLAQGGVGQDREVGSQELADRLHLRQLQFGRDRRGDRVAYPAQRVDGVGLGDGQQGADVVEFGLCGGGRGEPGPPAWSAVACCVGGELDAPEPLAVAATFELRALRPKFLAVLTAAGTPPGHRTWC
ncbi:MAG TPA: hypothetical protein VM677_33220 [Actinokineospora sp.]|nr:hypothetical protein [Actinokineospora sp.]